MTPRSPSKALLILGMLAASAPAAAQEAEQQPAPVETPDAPAQPAPAEQLPERAQQVVIPENIQIGLSTNRVAITADFTGADLTIFGSVDNVDPQISRQGRYDVVVVLEGPVRAATVRRKDRFLGIWINLEQEIFVNVPMSYSVATTRAPQDITDANSYKRMSLGAANLHIEPLDGAGNPMRIETFRAALRERKLANGLYSLNVGGVQFLSESLFRASLILAPNVPVGTHRARAFLFRNGVFIRESSAQLAIVKSGLEQRIALAAVNHSFLYGVFAVALAVVTGWVGRMLFRRD